MSLPPHSLQFPTSRSFLTSLFTTLQTISPSSDPASQSEMNHTSPSLSPSNSLLNASRNTKSLFLTLHCLFPNELLPALDLLDRRLVIKFDITRSKIGRADEMESLRERGNERIGDTERDGDGESGEHNGNGVYYVRSSQPPPPPSSRYNHHQYGSIGKGGPNYYEVRLYAWNCTCPAFIFSLLNNLQPFIPSRPTDPLHESTNLTPPLTTTTTSQKAEWTFGGLSLDGEDGVEMPMPICKHLLACVLVEKGSRNLFKGFVEERSVSVEEGAGWAAGWGG